jgi:hypothetical protein
MNRAGHALLRAVIERNVGLKDAIAKGDCKIIAAEINGWMPPDMQITPANVHEALKGCAAYPVPTVNATVLRERIDAIPELFSARVNCALRGNAGIGAMQAIANELNKSPDPAERVTVSDVEAAMGLTIVPQPAKTAAGAATLEGRGGQG